MSRLLSKNVQYKIIQVSQLYTKFGRWIEQFCKLEIENFCKIYMEEAQRNSKLDKTKKFWYLFLLNFDCPCQTFIYRGDAGH